MSGAPSLEGAKELLALMERVEAVAPELEAARAARVSAAMALKSAEARVTQAQAEMTSALRAIGKLLDGMDCSSVGNWGYEGRIGWLLLELRRLTLAKVNKTTYTIPNTDVENGID